MIEIIYQFDNSAPQWPTFWVGFWGAVSLMIFVWLYHDDLPRNWHSWKGAFMLCGTPFFLSFIFFYLRYTQQLDEFAFHKLKISQGHLMVAEGELKHIELTRLSEKLLVGGTVLHSYLPARGGADGYGCWGDSFYYSSKIEVGDILVLEYMMYKKAHPVELDDGRILTETPCILSVKKLNAPSK